MENKAFEQMIKEYDKRKDIHYYLYQIYLYFVLIFIFLLLHSLIKLMSLHSKRNQTSRMNIIRI